MPDARLARTPVPQTRDHEPHVHIIAVPSDTDGLWCTFRRAHPDYTGYINARMRVTGHLWQGRYGSVAMDEEHLMAAFRYVALNPVRARLVERACPPCGQSNRFVQVEPALERVGDFAAFLKEPFDEDAAYGPLRRAESVGRPVGASEWIEAMEAKTGLELKPRKRGPAPKQKTGEKPIIRMASIVTSHRSGLLLHYPTQLM